MDDGESEDTPVNSLGEMVTPPAPPPPPPLPNAASSRVSSCNSYSHHDKTSKPLLSPTKSFKTSRDTFLPVQVHFAINNSNTERVKELINSGINLDFIIYSHTPLTLSIIKEHYEIAHLLLDGGADVNIPEQMPLRRFPLHMVAKAGKLNLVKKIVSMGGNINEKDTGLATALHWAALNGHHQIVEWLITNDAKLENFDQVGHTPLFRAVEGSHTEVVRLLVDNGASVNVADKHQWSPLHHTAVCNDLVLAKDLVINYRCSVDMATDKGQTALHLLAHRLALDNLLTLSRTDYDFYLRDRQLSCSASKRAVERLDRNTELSIAELLIDYGANVSLTNHIGETPLYIAAKDNNYSLMKLFASAGSDFSREYWIEQKLWPVKLLGHLEACVWLYEQWENRIKGLGELCKLTIRRCIRTDINSKIQCLPLPARLLDFVKVHREE